MKAQVSDMFYCFFGLLWVLDNEWGSLTSYENEYNAI